MSAREVVRQMKRDGFTVREIIEITGKHPVTVYRDLIDYNEQRRLKKEKIRRENGQESYVCGVCRRRGHNARRHTDAERAAAKAEPEEPKSTAIVVTPEWRVLMIKVREDLKLSRLSLASTLGVSARALAKIEEGLVRRSRLVGPISRRLLIPMP